ncbi:bactofilin family protein [Bacillus alkalicellulosilyticus]|uniref:bactofilin family protein n=1 Tax=Alkalihalobacterium alkalicellulosilyticum TaxID=1912214 RepID=UPI000995FE7C|nr:polymer-forming cytoskeletal protein [Bacillus alkalicellulosilyticus]
MFSKQKEEKKRTELSTIIGEDTVVEGTIKIESGLRVDGKVYGEIKCSGDVTIGKQGIVEETIFARNLFIAGKVTGKVTVEEKIHIYETGSLQGSAEMKSIVIDENGFFRGESFMKPAVNEGENVVKLAKEISE